MSSLAARTGRLLPYAVLFVVAIAVDVELARPLRSASVGFDSQASVLYFQRIASGERLEIFVTTAPKPLVTALFGGLFTLTHDWRVLAWLTILAHASGVTLTSWLAGRVAGPVAAAFVGAALINDSNLLFDVGYAMATPFALVGWALAGLAISAQRPRPALAGASLALASLARVETLVVVGLALLLVVWVVAAPTIRGPRSRSARRPADWWSLPVIGLLGVPIMLVHDQLLAGDPFYWTRVATVYAEGARQALPSPYDVIATIAERYWAMAGVVLLAGVGAVWLRRSAPGLLLGLAMLGPAVAALLVLLAARHIAVPSRYLAPVDVALIFAAGVGLAFLSLRLARVDARDGHPVAPARAVTLGLVAVAVVAALGLGGFYWQQNPRLRDGVRASLHLAIDTGLAEPHLSIQAGAPSGQPAILVPVAVLPRVAVDLGLRLPIVAKTNVEDVAIGGGYPSRGQVVFHDREADGRSPGLAALEVDVPQVAGTVRLEPLFVDVARGVWVIAVR